MSKLVLENTAETYDRVYRDGYNKSYPTVDLVRLERWYFEGGPGRALDYGCGPGTNGMHLVDSGYEVVFTDIVADALKRVQDKLDRRPEAASRATVRLVDRNADNLPDDDNSFDFVICLSMISNLGSAENVRHLISEFHRVLKPGGKMIVDINGPVDKAPDRGDLFENQLVRYEVKSADDFAELVGSIPGIIIDEIGQALFTYQGRSENEFILCARKQGG